ncbi:MAG: 50S ribosomal protein L34e [Candidatus Aenigmarchaeota archaeon]|nr:50S ribosomal protein L34e [Candidatus Aenigmarchaeota archaeon]
MPRPAQRSRSFRKKPVNTPGGRQTIHYLKKGPCIARCAVCKRPLHGVPSGLPSEMRKLKKTSKRPDRPYGGNMCSACSRETVKSKNIARWEND